MSADNTIVILKLKDQSRVIHAQAIENLWWSILKMEPECDLVSTRVVEFFGNASVMSHVGALLKAVEIEHEILEDDFGILEYGIRTIHLNKTWDEVVTEAKELLPKEVGSVMKEGRDDLRECLMDELFRLRNILYPEDLKIPKGDCSLGYDLTI